MVSVGSVGFWCLVNLRLRCFVWCFLGIFVEHTNAVSYLGPERWDLQPHDNSLISVFDMIF